jgi:hypothetical protein
MARPRRHHDAAVPEQRAADGSTSVPRREVTVRPDEESELDRERVADAIVELMAEWMRERVDYDDPAHARFWEWKADEAKARLSPAERARLVEEAQAFAKRVLAEEARRRASKNEGPAGKATHDERGTE